MEIGIDSFAAAFDENSRAVSPAARLRHLIEQIEHADEVGLDTFDVGEHHRREFLDFSRTEKRCGPRMSERNGPAETDAQTDRLCKPGGLRETLGSRQPGGSGSLWSVRLREFPDWNDDNGARRPFCRGIFVFVSGAMFSDFVVCELLQRF